MKVLEVSNLKKIYGSREGVKVEALSNVNFSVDRGEFIAIMGESGSGKTTLLNVLSTLDRPTSGTILLEGKDMAGLRDKDVAAFRREHLGFVFQEFNLLNNFSNKDNIMLPLVLSGKPVREMEESVMRVAKILSLEEQLKKYPYEVSGGQKQRIAVARAMITDPYLIMADEPTGSLDSASAENLLETFRKINGEGHTILMVTHSIKAASYANRVLFIRDGRIFYEIHKGDDDNNQFMTRIINTQSLINRGGDLDDR